MKKKNYDGKLDDNQKALEQKVTVICKHYFGTEGVIFIMIFSFFFKFYLLLRFIKLCLTIFKILYLIRFQIYFIYYFYLSILLLSI